MISKKAGIKDVWDLCSLKVVPNKKFKSSSHFLVWDLCNLKVVPNIYETYSLSSVVWDLCNLKVVPNQSDLILPLLTVWDLCNLKVVPNTKRVRPTAREVWDLCNLSATKLPNQEKNEGFVFLVFSEKPSPNLFIMSNSTNTAMLITAIKIGTWFYI